MPSNHDHMDGSSPTPPEQQLAGGPHAVWEAAATRRGSRERPTGKGLGYSVRAGLGGRRGPRRGGDWLLIDPELVHVQPRDLEVLDPEAADHRSSDRQPANRQGADGPGADSRRPDRGRADSDRGQEQHRRLLAAAAREPHRTVGASPVVHAMVLL
jgi:hypothetical protein